MASNRALLPPNATRLQRELAQLHTLGWADMAAQVEPAADPDVLQPWIAQQWQISQFDRYFADPRGLIEAGLPWLRERGSAAAVKRAMGWLGYTGVLIEEDGARLHINPGAEVSLAQLRKVVHVVRASIPLHVRLYRVYYRFDRRRLRLDAYPGLDNGLIGRDSGVSVDIDGDVVLASQGQFFTVEAQRPGNANVQAQAGTHWLQEVRRPDVMRLDAWRLDGAVRRPLLQLSEITTSHVVPAYVRLQTFDDHSTTQSTTVPQRSGAIDWLQTITHTVEVPRTLPARSWTGGWDSHQWQESQIITQYTEEQTL
ncbi:phage tail protein [Comamonas sp. J-3]|uniref:phage tail protein n=1 Tax=Comamonas trifloxystrobinivorans TaxID=3350256 RepID=UPI003729548C